MVVLGDKMAIFGPVVSGQGVIGSSYYRSLWFTEDGDSWVKVHGRIGPLDTPYVPRGMDSCVYKNRIWGLSFNEVTEVGKLFSIDNDVSVNSSPLPPEMGYREDEAFLAHSGKLVLIGGFTRRASGGAIPPYYCTNDVWTSVNGVDWTRELVAAPFSPRRTHTAVSFNDRIWVIGGWNSGPGLHPARDDVWSSGQGPAPQLSPASLSFGARDPENGASQPVTVRLSNPFPDAWEPIVLTDIRIEDDPSGSFSFAETPDLRAILVGETRKIDIIYTPSSNDYVTAQLVIETASETGEELVVPVAGGTEPLPSGAANWMMY